MRCLCGRVKQEVGLAAETFPVKTYLCHGDTCRSTSGTLCTAYLSLTSTPTTLADMAAYHSSEALVRYFCRTCGAHTFAHEALTGKSWVCSGTIDHGGDIVQITHHQWVQDTGDGGLAAFMTRIQDRGLAAYARDSGQQIVNPRVLHGGEEITLQDPGDPEIEAPHPPTQPLRQRRTLHAKCHCGGVEYHVTPPSKLSEELSSPWPDLLVPYHSGSPENKQDVKWWMRAGKSKFLAGLCACRSCRLAAGFPIQSWAFIPKVNIVKPHSTTMEFSFGTLQQYQSSPGVFREFCSRCGATVFWHCEERPDLIDVSVGLLRSESGARAEDWLEWETGRVSFKEDAADQELVTALESGLGAFKAQHRSPAHN